MSATIRDYIKRRVWWCVGIAVAGWLMFPLGAAIAKNLPDGVSKAAVPVVGFVMFGGAILAMQWMVRCPKCKARLGRTIAMPVAFSWGSGPRVNFCPYCGVNLEEPLPHSEPDGQSQDPIHPA
jgi:hypothetical protein